MTYSHAKGRGQRSVSSKDRVERVLGGQTDRAYCITFLVNMVTKEKKKKTFCMKKMLMMLLLLIVNTVGM